ncbi:zinc-containing alcohol dehydrogenase [Sulfobacillus acidophilus TPY]|uniref:Alcohol dehydrogenase n=1 Tax=Sulfobacillus acidophilus (strain ATCC 700253 / DSM 10332 / NAL) TaxID=679936 RepID=G8TZJ2_SULAD|nr:zinc-containing alcohol dehydrogenase [Sulfobacillus acidophilus TPY]AEW05232.1 Alcohol dehydrogenase GroES domain protein [Sulfobacillus acidophilus DSM 10332]
MKAGRIHAYHEPIHIDDINEPRIEKDTDVIVKIGGAGVCRTDLHIIEGIWKDALGNPPLPYTIGHENAGWIEAVGSGITHLKKGDPVILHPLMSCGLCPACRAGRDMYCTQGHFPGLDGTDGGYAEYLKTSVRSVIPLAPGTDPVPLAPFADAGITAYHAVKKLVPLTAPGTTVAVIGIGGLGHFAVQILRALTPATVIAIDTQSQRLDFATEIGAHHAVLAGSDGGVGGVKRIAPNGVDIVIDFVGEHQTPAAGVNMLAKGGTYSVVGYGGEVQVPTLEFVNREINIVGNLVGTYNELAELMELNRQGKVVISAQQFPLADAPQVMEMLDRGEIKGRAILIP